MAPGINANFPHCSFFSNEFRTLPGRREPDLNAEQQEAERMRSRASATPADVQKADAELNQIEKERGLLAALSEEADTVAGTERTLNKQAKELEKELTRLLHSRSTDSSNEWPVALIDYRIFGRNLEKYLSGVRAYIHDCSKKLPAQRDTLTRSYLRDFRTYLDAMQRQIENAELGVHLYGHEKNLPGQVIAKQTKTDLLHVICFHRVQLDIDLEDVSSAAQSRSQSLAANDRHKKLADNEFVAGPIDHPFRQMRTACCMLFGPSDPRNKSRLRTPFSSATTKRRNSLIFFLPSCLRSAARGCSGLSDISSTDIMPRKRSSSSNSSMGKGPAWA